MKRPLQLLVSIALSLIALAPFTNSQAEIESIDLKALAKKARPAVMLLVVSDTNGKEIATGTGFLVSSDGKLITNHHVIEGAASVVAKTENGGLFTVEGILADDPKNDLVLLKLNVKDLPYLTFGNSEKIEVGTRIAVIGSPLGLEGSLSEGIISGERELMSDVRKLQITAAISPGSSGSPVLNAKGEVVGIASALLEGGQALNFAVPVEYGVQLLAKVKPFSIPQPLSASINAGEEDAIYSDPDGQASIANEAAGDYVEMLKHTKALVARYPDNAVAWFGLGIAFGKINFTDDAITSFRQAIKIKPDYAKAWENLGLAYGESGHTDDAIAACRQAIKIKPDDAVAWYNLGVNYYNSGLAQQMRYDEEGRVLNPALLGFLTEIRAKTNELSVEIPELWPSKNPFQNMVIGACSLIQCVVQEKLSTPKQIQGLELVGAMASSRDIERLDVFTLNHDILVERFLTGQAFDYVDGFGRATGNSTVRRFDPELFEGDAKVRLFKLHGSIDWFMFADTGGPFCGIPMNGDPNCCQNESGEQLWNFLNGAVFLAGTHNKIINYGFSVIAEMHFWFHKLLKEYDAICMCGYGWNDFGVNTRLSEWFYPPRKTRLCLMHENPEEIAKNPRSLMEKIYGGLVADRRLILVKKWMGNVTLQEVLDSFNA